MNGLKLKKLEIKNFRGIRDFTLNFDKKSWFICGANGTGKSSIVNALQYLFTDSINISCDKGVNDDNESIPHIRSSKEELLVKAEFTRGTMTKTFNKRSKLSKGLNKFIDSSFANGSFILNRSKLLNFVDAKEKERYDKLSILFGFGDLDELENSFKKGKSKINSSLRQSLKDSYSILYNISNKGIFLENLENKDKPSKSAINKAYSNIIEEFNNILKSNNLPLINEGITFDDCKHYLHDYLLYGKVEEYKEKINELLNHLVISKEEYDEIIKVYSNVVRNNLKSSDLLLELLNNSKEFLEIMDDELCPVCGKKIDINDTKSLVYGKINKLEEELSSFKNWKITTQSFIEVLNNLKKDLDNIEINISELNNILTNFNSSILIEDGLIVLSEDLTINLIKDFNNLIKHNISITDFNQENIYSLINNLDSIKNIIRDRINNLDLKNPNNELSFIYDSLDDLNTFSNLSQKIEVLDYQFNKADATHKLFSKLKVDYIDEVINQIEDDVIEYYTFIHNDDKINNPRLIASKSKGVKLVVDAFGIEESDPRSYSSEGHLDTLGLCIFLAAVKNLNKVPIIVLDDIIATVDMSHKGRIARLLFEKFNKYQFIITTHNKLWLNQFKLLSSFYKDEGQEGFRFCEIIDWDVYNGPKFREFIEDEKFIKHHLDSKYQDLFAAANGARRYLEHTLYDICKEYGANVPILDKYSVGDLFKPANDKLLDLTKGTKFEEYYENIFKDLKKYKYPANALSHFNETNDLLEYDEVKHYVDAVFKLRDSVTCDKCNSMLSIKNKKIFCSKKSKHYDVNMKEI